MALLLGSCAGFAVAHVTNRSLKDRVAIERQINLYAECLDWDRADEATGKELFLGIFTDDCRVGYPYFGFWFIGKGDNAPTEAEPGGIGWMYSDFNIACQTLSLTLETNIVIDINGKEATTSDRFSHIGYLAGDDHVYQNASYTWGYHEGKWRKENGQWKCYEWNGFPQFNSTV